MVPSRYVDARPHQRVRQAPVLEGHAIDAPRIHTTWRGALRISQRLPVFTEMFATVTKPPTCAIVGCIFAAATSGRAHNGAVAYAAAISMGIAIDGHVSDWPSDVGTYPIARTEFGDDELSTEDFSGDFQVAFEPSAGDLYVAVTITDDSYEPRFIQPTSNAQIQRFIGLLWWRPEALGDMARLPDGCAVILNLGHEDRFGRTIRFGVEGERRSLLNPASRDTIAWQAGEVAWSSEDGVRTYEFRLHLGDPVLFDGIPVVAPQVGDAIEFDITASDRDADGSFHWVAWGGGAGKMWDFRTRGDLLIHSPSVPMATVRGRATWIDTLERVAPHAVRLRSEIGSATMITDTDGEGRYQIDVPAGFWHLSVEDRRLGLDRREERVQLHAGDISELVVADEPIIKHSMISTHFRQNRPTPSEDQCRCRDKGAYPGSLGEK